MIPCYVKDLMFKEKLNTAARLLNVEIKFIKNADELLPETNRLIVDLQLDSDEVLKKASSQGIECIGFVSHVDTEAIARAKSLGCKPVPRSVFFTNLEKFLMERQ